MHAYLGSEKEAELHSPAATWPRLVSFNASWSSSSLRVAYLGHLPNKHYPTSSTKRKADGDGGLVQGGRIGRRVSGLAAPVLHSVERPG